MAEKLEMKSKNVIKDNIAIIEEYFPDCITETCIDGKISKTVDFNKLRNKLTTDTIFPEVERYQFTWPNKQKNINETNKITNSTLRPVLDSSLNFENTQNIYIKGDNLEVLKTIRYVYQNSIKMIYIDPPYNTGEDFVYHDNFDMSISEYIESNHERDDLGNRFYQNTSTDGRFHTNWLNMMYPRLYIARDLLKKDGIIFISIGKDEISNLTKICDEIFGESNHISTISWVSKSGGSADEKYIINAVEYILVYAKNKNTLKIGKDSTNTSDDKYRLKDEFVSTRGKYLLKKLDYRMTSKHYTESLNYSIEDPDGNQLWPGGEQTRQNGGWNWRWSKSKVEWGFKNGFLEFVKNKKGWTLNSKQYQYVDNKGNLIDRSISYRNFINSDEFNTSQGSKQIVDYFGSKLFEYAKPIGLIERLISIANLDQDDIILDFFSGSSTTAHAVMDYNLKNNTNYHYIMIQIPEGKELPDISEYNNICDLAMSRIKIAGKLLHEQQDKNSKNIDFGFRVFTLDSSNMKDVYYEPANIKRSDLNQYLNNIKDDRTSEDLLFQVMLELGIELSAHITSEKINDNCIFTVDNGYLVACFDENIPESTISELAKQKPEFLILRDASSIDDSTSINFEQILKAYSPSTTMKTL